MQALQIQSNLLEYSKPCCNRLQLSSFLSAQLKDVALELLVPLVEQLAEDCSPTLTLQLEDVGLSVVLARESALVVVVRHKD